MTETVRIPVGEQMLDLDGAGDLIDRVQDAVTRADESLVMLAGVPIARTQSARHTLDATRLTVLERMLDEVRGLVGLPAPVAPGQTTLEVGG